jgi:uncharacterized membrane protein
MKIISAIRKDWIKATAEIAAVGAVVAGVAYGIKSGDWITAAYIVTFGIAGSGLFHEIGKKVREDFIVDQIANRRRASFDQAHK